MKPRKPMGRPRGTAPPPRYTVRIMPLVSPDQRDWCEQEAARRGITLAALIRLLIEWARDDEQTPIEQSDLARMAQYDATAAELYAKVRATPDKPLSPRAAAWAKNHEEKRSN